MLKMADLAGLQTELKGAKEKWTDYLKLGKAKKEEPTFPFPVWVSLAAQRPPNAKAFDMEEMTVKLCVDSLDKGDVHVEFPQKDLPDQLKEKMIPEVLKVWNKKIGKKDAPWGIAPTLEWVETNYAKLLLLEPTCLHAYEGCDENDMSMKRYAIGPPPEPVDENEEESESEEEETQAEYEARMAVLLGDLEADSNKKGLSEAEIEQKKKEAAEMGEKHRQLSKKELAEKNKSKQGVRMAKTGASARKFDGEGATSKEEKKKKADANVKKRFGI